MGKEANIVQKSRKSVVQLYRTFLKVSMASLIYTVFALILGKSTEISIAGAFEACSLTVTLAVICAVLYKFTYYLYKYGKNSEYDQQARLEIQISALLRIIIFFAGAFSAICGAVLVHNKSYVGYALVVLGIVVAEQLYDNKKLFSRISTFSENAAAGFIIVTMKLIYDGNKLALATAAAGVAMLALQEIAFHHYNIKKHPFSGHTLGEVKRIRVMTFFRNLLVAFVLLFIWWTLVVTGSAAALFGSNLYEKLIKIVPIIISLITVSVLLYNNFIKKPPKENKGYDVKASAKELRGELQSRYGADSASVKALDYVTESMTAEKGYKRSSGEDYFIHPLAVAKILLANAVVSEDVITVALLHDCIEDIEGAEKYILANFEPHICELVLSVSKKADVDYSVPKNMTAYLENAFSSEVGALVKTADRMNNNSTMRSYSEEKKKRKSLETRVYYIPAVAKAGKEYTQNSRFFDLAEKFFSQPIE